MRHHGFPTLASIFLLALASSPALRADTQDLPPAPADTPGETAPPHAEAAPETPSPPAPLHARPGSGPPTVFELNAERDTTGTPKQPPAAPVLPPNTAPPGQRRKLPDYRGRAEGPASLGTTLIWVPRTVLMPVHLLAEYGIRKPAVAGIALSEKHHVFERIHRLLTWRDGRYGIFPTFTLDRGIQPSFGATVFGRPEALPETSLRLSARVGADDVLVVGGQARTRVFRNGAGQLAITGGYRRRPDGVFYPLDNDTVNDDRTFFSFREAQGGVGLVGDLSGLNRVYLDTLMRSIRFSGSDVSDQFPSTTAVFGGPGQPPLPPGFIDGYELWKTRVRLVLDSREPIDVKYEGTGLRLETDLAFSVDPAQSATNFVNWGVELAGFYDFTGFNHTLGMSLLTAFVENTGNNPVPFTELVTLGGMEYMPGFLYGRLRDESALVLTLQYRYPIWAFLDASLFTTLGNVFPNHLDGFRPDRLYWNYGVAWRTNYSRDTSILLAFAFGSTRLDAEDFDAIDFTRIFFGVVNGF